MGGGFCTGWSLSTTLWYVVVITTGDCPQCSAMLAAFHCFFPNYTFLLNNFLSDGFQFLNVLIAIP